MPTTRTMTPPKIERRLAAILAADVARYSQLMGIDEVGTLNALKAHRRERIDPAIARHNGRIVKTTGDGLLVEFASVVDAVGCAVAIQRAMLAFNAGIHADRQIVLRIGINVGDIIIDGGDIFGDGVNVAARLEALCEPGGVCISRSANEQVRDKLLLTFADLGEQTVKNIAHAVGVFGLAAKDIAALPEEGLPEPEPPELRTPLAPARRRRPAGAMVACGVVLAMIFASGGWWMLRDRTSPSAVTSAMAPAAPRPPAYSPQDRRQSVIVLPFENSSGDPAQDSVAADITRRVTDLISRDKTVPLVPAATAVAYNGKTLDLHAIAREHDVHFALTGNVRRQDGHLIVSATLYDTADLRPIWSQRFDRPDSPDEWWLIPAIINSNFQQATTDAEVARAMREHPNDLDKRDVMYAENATSLRQISKAHTQAKIALIDRALALDPDYVWALREMARKRADLVNNGFSPDPLADLTIAAKAVDRALMLAPNDYTTLREKANVLRAQGNLDEAAALLRGLIERNPTQAHRYRELGAIQLTQGHPTEALENFMTAKRLVMGDDMVEPIDSIIAVALLANDRFPEAIEQARRTIPEIPAESGGIAEAPWLALIAAERESGQEAQARADLQKFLSTPRVWHTMAEVQKVPYLAANPKLLDGLRRAGMPEE
jgi:adenylate cyclase